jgi:DNA (cytosine-5)-methyltransferase 1
LLPEQGGRREALGYQLCALIAGCFFVAGALMYKHFVHPKPTFIDLFSGCGGLSLGLSQAGWQGMFAIERATDAFETFRANLLQGPRHYQFEWPTWLEQKAHSIDDVLEQHRDELGRLHGKVDLIAGGPPCQGFSFAGRRNASDPRNKMFERYVSFVDIIRPKFLVLENVPGMKVAHTTCASRRARPGKTYYEKLLEALNGLGYTAGGMILDASNYGVPQRRARLVVVGMRDDIGKQMEAGYTDTFEKIAAEGKKQLHEYGSGRPVTAEQAISDLAVGNRRTIEYTGFGARKGYFQVNYVGPSKAAYQNLMHSGTAPEAMDSMRLANHCEEVLERFEVILKRCRRGVSLSNDDRERFRMLKHRTVPMSASQPAPTLTTLPDDILHYSDPRILTVRECARIQSFPDWFVFKGKYTTGGDRRRVECPRYTQVGNAVPPLLARAIGVGVLESWREVSTKIAKRSVGIDIGMANVRKPIRINRR